MDREDVLSNVLTLIHIGKYERLQMQVFIAKDESKHRMI